MRSYLRLAVVCVVLLLPRAVSAELVAKLEDSILRVEGASPGGEVAVLGVLREEVRGGPHASQTNVEEAIVDDDGDGVVELDLERKPPLVSVFAVVDVKTGETSVIAPEKFAVRSMSLGKDAAFGKQVGRVLVTRRELQVLVVRPEVGKWRGRTVDGGGRDEDGRPDRGVTLTLDVLDNEDSKAVGPEFRRGDTVIAIDPIQMDILTLRLE